MNKNKKWLLALSVAGLITANGIAMAAVNTETQDEKSGQRPAFTDKGEVMKNVGMRGHKEEQTALLSLLNIDAETFKTEMQAGKSLVAIANEQGVSEQALKDFMAQQMTKRIDEGVTAGKISADKAEQMKANMEQRITDMINGQGMMHKERGEMGKHRIFDNAELLAMLNIDAETLKTEMQAGKSFVAIAQEHGVSEQALKDSMAQKMTKRVDEGIAAGKISADKAEQMKANMDERITDMINGKGPMHDGKGMMHKGHRLGSEETDNK